ncbi:flagellum biosynthesis repressor protein FlbT [Alphaproteobacteria bacterium SO-S41]|nr:flagellum biosynthesis repressor protein FlbT [Alphaproteobacteria bacterium SO-S41]
MPLKLSLKPHEKFVVNGAVMTNGDRKAEVIIQNRASILREKDILQPADAQTPLRRVYFPIQMMYLESSSGGENIDAYYDTFADRMADFMGVISNPDVMAACVAISRDVLGGHYYRALMTCRRLFDYEQERLNYAPESVPADA